MDFEESGWLRGGPRTRVFGRRLRELRIELDFTQERSAELANSHRNYFGGVERGERNLGLLNIVDLAHALRVKPAELLEPIP